MAKKINKTVLTLACVATLGAAQIAPVAVPVFGYTSVKAESPAEEIVAVVVKGVDDSGELLSGPAVTIHPESESYTVVAEDIEGYTPVSYLVLAQSFLWETRGSGNEVTFSHQDAFSRGETMVDVVFSYTRNELPPKSPEDSPISDQGGGQQDGSNNGDVDNFTEPPAPEETTPPTLDTTTPPSNNGTSGNQEGNIPTLSPDEQATPPKEDVAPPKPGEPAPEAPKDTQPPIDTIKGNNPDDQLPPKTTPETSQKTPEGQGSPSTPSTDKSATFDKKTPTVQSSVVATLAKPVSVTPTPQETSKKTLPNTGDSSLVGAALSGLGSLLSGIGLFSLRKKD